jgi:hypothetical protein
MWSQNWGSMIWGRSSPAVPLLGPLGLLLLALVLMVSGALISRHPSARRLMGKATLVLLLLVPVSALAVPFTFTNGTVADATQVNQNFSTLETRIAALEAKKTLAFAHVNANGTIDNDSGNLTVSKVAAGMYCAGVTGATPKVAVVSLDSLANVGGTVQAGVFAASGCPAGAQQILVITRPQSQDGGQPGQDRAFYITIN